MDACKNTHNLLLMAGPSYIYCEHLSSVLCIVHPPSYSHYMPLVFIQIPTITTLISNIQGSLDKYGNGGKLLYFCLSLSNIFRIYSGDGYYISIDRSM